MTADGDVLVFQRFTEEEIIFCAFNMGEGSAGITLPPGQWVGIGGALGTVEIGPDNHAQLGPWQACLALNTG